MKTLSIAISPCPNDTFIFENIYTEKIGIDGYTFDFDFLDIEELNKCAAAKKKDIIKISYAQYFQVKDNYTLLRSGGAMGFGVGPLLIQKKDANVNLSTAKIAIPGQHTTANFLLRYLFPNAKNKYSLLFSDIENAVLQGNADAGLVIHEGRFTYAEKGLAKIADLGELWQEKTGLPIPLGCIVIKKSLGEELKNEVEALIAQSIPPLQQAIILSDFIKMHAQEMEPQVMLKHIQLYVNDFSKDIGPLGEAAFAKMETVLSAKE